PLLSRIKDDKPKIYANGCHARTAGVEPKVCHFGDKESRTTFFLTGDSHAAQWSPALEKIAIRNRWSLYVSTKSSCPLTIDSVFKSGVVYEKCKMWSAK